MNKYQMMFILSTVWIIIALLPSFTIYFYVLLSLPGLQFYTALRLDSFYVVALSELIYSLLVILHAHPFSPSHALSHLLFMMQKMSETGSRGKHR